MTVTAPTRAPMVGDTAALLDAGEATAMIQRAGLAVTAAEPTYLRIKPGHSGLVGYRLHRDGAEPTLAYAVTWAPGVAPTERRKWVRLPGAGTDAEPAVLALRPAQTFLLRFPYDARLGSLERILDPQASKRLLGELDALRGQRVQARRSRASLVRWKPERRLVARARVRLAGPGDVRDERDVHLRWFVDGRGRDIAATAAALHRAGVATASPIGTAAGGRLYVEETLVGGAGPAAVLDGTLDAAAIAELMARLAAVRAGPVTAGATAERRARAAREALQLLGLMAPQLRELIDGVHERLVPPPVEAPTAFLHGDLHLHQYLVPAGGVPAVIDLERAGSGDPMVDTAATLAHLTELGGEEPAAAARLAAVASEVTERVLRRPDAGAAPGARLAFHRRCSLVERALLALRELRPSWAATAEHLLLAAAADPLAAWDDIRPRLGRAGWAATRRSGDGSATVQAVLDPVAGTATVVGAGTDRALPGLRCWLEQATLVTHRPGRRAVLRTTDGAYVKVLRPARAAEVVQRWQAVEQARRCRPRDLPAVPRVRSSDPAHGVLVVDALGGSPLHGILMDPDAGRRADALLVVAHRLRTATDVDVAGLEVGLPATAVDVDLHRWWAAVATVVPAAAAEFHRALELLPAAVATVVPAAAAEFHRALELLPAAAAAGRGLVHGDLHDRNLFLDAGGQVGWIDLDDAGIGHPGVDVGNLAAHVQLRALQRGAPPGPAAGEARVFLESATARDLDAVDVWRRRTLFRLACVYTFRRRWRHLVRPLLDGAAPDAPSA